MPTEEEISKVKKGVKLDISDGVASELLTLSNNVDLAIEASNASRGIDQCKAYIINKRFKRIEKEMKMNNNEIKNLSEIEEKIREEKCRITMRKIFVLGAFAVVICYIIFGLFNAA